MKRRPPWNAWPARPLPRVLRIVRFASQDVAMPAETRLFLCLKDNYGVLLHDLERGAPASIDAPEAPPIEAALKAAGWNLTDILVTHHHSDHTGGIATLKTNNNAAWGGPRRERGRFRGGARRCARATRSRSANYQPMLSRRPVTPMGTSSTGFTSTSSPSLATRCSRSAAAACSKARPA